MLNRIVLRLRWPLSITATVLLAFAFISPFRYCWVVVPVGPESRLALGFRSGATAVTIVEDSDSSSLWRLSWGDNLIRSGFGNRAEPDFSGWWDFAAYEELIMAQQLLVLPSWVVAVPLGLLSWIGFGGHRKRMLNAGICSRCHHTLAGSSVCAECGHPAPPN